VKHRYDRWIEVSVLDGMLAVLAREADLALMMTECKEKGRARPWLGRDPGCR
jgi:hypothetical protein